MDVVSDTQHEAAPASAQTIRLSAAEWHDRRERDGWTKDDEDALAVWFGQSPAHKVAFLRVDAAWKRADRLNALRIPGASAVSPRSRISGQSPSKWWQLPRWWLPPDSRPRLTS